MNKKKLIGMIIGVTAFAALIAGATFAWLTFGVTVGNNVLTANTLNFIVEFDGGDDVTNLPILDSNYIEAKDAAVVKVVLKKNPTSPDGHASIWLNTTSDTKLTEDSVVRYVICRDPDVEDGDQVDDSCGNKVLMRNDLPTYQECLDTADNLDECPLNAGAITGSGPIPLLSDARFIEYAGQGISEGKLVDGCTTESGISMCTGTGEDNNQKMLEEDGVSYFVYMWLEAEPLLNEHLDEQYQKTGSTEQYKVGGGGTPDYDAGIKFDLYSGFVFASATQLQD